MNCKEILEKYLRDNGYDGLYSEAECACELEDLIPCDEDPSTCEPGYKIPCPEDCGDHDFHIIAEKPENIPPPAEENGIR